MTSQYPRLARTPAVPGPVDPVEEFRLRVWARANYVSRDQRRDDWHPVVYDEMNRKDSESST